MAQSLTFVQGSSPEIWETLRLVSHALPTPLAGQVLVKLSAAPINPLDLLVLNGKYLVKPTTFIDSHPVPGYDGIGTVIQCGDGVKSLAPGDKVIVKRHGLGTWRTHAALNEADVIKVPGDLDPRHGAILRMGLTPAYFLLNEAKDLQPGDWIIQNAASGAIAHFIAQLAALQGYQVISVVRSREDVSHLKQQLESHGASLVIEETDLENPELFNGKRIRLAFDAVFGSVAEQMAHRCSPGATFVTYGFLSGMDESASIRISPKIIWVNQIHFKGFRFSKALASRSDEEQEALFAWLSSMLIEGRLTLPLLDFVIWDSQSTDLESRLKQAVASSTSVALGSRKKIIVFKD
ncbi:MAG: hypothetical protein M1819_005385 [Sarea resinae]|nr:MAG: hypothetical protein M1819_005385 [Sarea resinae]